MSFAGGLLDMRGRVSDEVPAHWLVYFGVEAIVSDPWGAFFAAIQAKERTD
jgi:hypothetical protein